jgi:hypothetical protein
VRAVAQAATRISAPARAFLATDRPLHILHVFADIVNLADADHQVLSLQRYPATLAPFGWEWAGAWPSGLSPATPARVAGGALWLGPQRLDPAGAPLWDPIPDWQALRALDPALLQPARPLPLDLARPLAALIKGLATGDQDGASAAAGRLLGRGAGLTPAGDDILVGVLHAHAVWYPYATLADRLVTVPQPGQTTTLSLAFLRAAAAGAAAEPWHDLCAGLPGAHARLLVVGATSGRDAWTGFAAAATLLRTLEERDG